MSFLFQEKGKEKGVQTSLMSFSSKHTSNNREEPIVLNRGEKTSLPNFHHQMSGKKQVNRNSPFYTSRSREALPRGQSHSVSWSGLRQTPAPNAAVWDGLLEGTRYLGSRCVLGLILLAVTWAALALRVRGAVWVTGALWLRTTGMCWGRCCCFWKWLRSAAKQPRDHLKAPRKVDPFLLVLFCPFFWYSKERTSVLLNISKLPLSSSCEKGLKWLKKKKSTKKNLK